jgi:hypothetical protein
MHPVAILLCAAAGIVYCVAAIARWREVARSSAPGPVAAILVAIGLGLHSGALVTGLAAGREHADFAYGVLAVWAAVASVFFLRRFLTAPSKSLLLLPLGGMAVIVAMAGLWDGRETPAPLQPATGMPWIVAVHIGFMVLHLAAALVAGAAAGLFLVARVQLKRATVGSLKLPNLPSLERLCERALIAATAALIGGLATGGAAAQLVPEFRLLHPTVMLSLLNMSLLIAGLGLRLAHQLGGRGIASAAIACALITAVAIVSQVVGPHG